MALEIKYITLEEFKEKTTLSKLPKDSILENLIIKAQMMIDYYIWDTNKTDVNQDWKFPINWDTTIPDNVQMTTIEIVQNLILEENRIAWWQISSEAWDWYSVSYNIWENVGNVEIFNWFIRNLLDEYWVNSNNQDLAAYKFNY